MAQPSSSHFGRVKADELSRAFELESQGFPSDEAASLETIQYRHRVAPELFIGTYDSSGQLLGFINATCSTTPTISHEGLTTHEPDAPYVLIHSVCIDNAYRRRGLARALLQHYITECKSPSFTALILVCHPELLPLYQAVGFKNAGLSDLIHGQRPWHQMRLDIHESSYQTPPRNDRDLICPVSQCRCVILKAGVGSLIEKETSPLPMADGEAQTRTKCWLVPTPLSFENISFTRPVGNASGEMRILACGACEFGPLGWTQAATNLAEAFASNPTGSFASVEFLIDCRRVSSS